MPRKKNPNNNYFNESVEQAIQDYNKAESDLERNRYFRIIYPAISKIAEVMYNKVKPIYMEGEPSDIMMDCVSYLTERMFRISEGKGKAFSYFTVCARNFYIFHNQRAYTGVKKVINYTNLPEDFDTADIVDNRLEEMEDVAALSSAFLDYIKENKTLIFKTKGQLRFMDELINLFETVENIEEFNRRDILNDIADRNPDVLERHSVTKFINRLNSHYVSFRKYWDIHKKPMPFLTKNSLTLAEIDYCANNFINNDRKYGIIALSKKFNVDSLVVSHALHSRGIKGKGRYY